MVSVFSSSLPAILARLRDVTSDLAQFAENDGPARPAATEAAAASLDEVATRLLRQRQARRQFLPVDLFHEPGWDMLIAVYVADRAGRPTNVKALVAMVDAPSTTAQRWIEHLDRLGLVARATDQLDRRRVEVSLTQTGQEALEKYLRALPDI